LVFDAATAAVCSRAKNTSASTSTEVVHINELLGGAETGAYLLQFDSVHGRYSKAVEALPDDTGFTVDGRCAVAHVHPNNSNAC
jgi:glyceraldehyde-3-phosphate dehydrogenase/erythrose-4-phosphate dehydrogenase